MQFAISSPTHNFVRPVSFACKVDITDMTSSLVSSKSMCEKAFLSFRASPCAFCRRQKQGRVEESGLFSIMKPWSFIELQQGQCLFTHLLTSERKELAL